MLILMSFTLLFLIFRILVPQSEFQISSETLMRSVNDLYRSNACDIKITSKSAKAAGVSSAFKKGLSNNDIMLMGRWRSPDTAQHYRDIDPFTLARISLVMAREDPVLSLEEPVPLNNQTWNQITQPELSLSVLNNLQYQDAIPVQPEPVPVQDLFCPPVLSHR